MNQKLNSTVNALKEKFRGAVSEFRGEITVTIDPDVIVEACAFLKDKSGFEMLVDITAVDYFPQKNPRFHLVYHVYSLKLNHFLVLRVHLHGDHPRVKTIENIYPNANWYEREIWDLMGVHFEGNHDLRRIMMPPGWEGHPLRKDYPLGYEEVQFTFNIDDIDRNKRYPKD